MLRGRLGFGKRFARHERRFHEFRCGFFVSIDDARSFVTSHEFRGVWIIWRESGGRVGTSMQLKTINSTAGDAQGMAAVN